MLKFFLYVLAGILGVALGVLVFLHQCVHLPQWTPTPSPTKHSVEWLLPKRLASQNRIDVIISKDSKISIEDGITRTFLGFPCL
jgi:hypothetical protein